MSIYNMFDMSKYLSELADDPSKHDPEQLKKISAFVAEKWYDFFKLGNDLNEARVVIGKERTKIERYKREVIIAQSNNKERNRELDALHYVWCDGGCYGGTHRWPCDGRSEITEELVNAAETQVTRLRRWFENRKARNARGRKC